MMRLRTEQLGYGLAMRVLQSDLYPQLEEAERAECDALIASADTPGWLPTAENINALPEPLRNYVVELETLCDAAGIVRENVLVRDENAQLRAALRKQKDEWIGITERPLPQWGPYDFATRVDLRFGDGTVLHNTPAGIWNWDPAVSNIFAYRMAR